MTRFALALALFCSLTLNSLGHCADSAAAPLACGYLQITGLHRAPGEAVTSVPLADPSLEFRCDGRVALYGTGYQRMVFPNIDDFVHGRRGKIEMLELQSPDGKVIHGHEGVWDLHAFTSNCAAGAKTPVILTGGAVTSKDGQSEGSMDLNIDRRAYRFDDIDPKQHRVFRREAEPLLGTRDTDHWVGHSYGRQPVQDGHGHLFADENGDSVLTYEKVSQEYELTETGGQKVNRKTTEIFARRFRVETRAHNPKLVFLGAEAKLLGISLPAGAQVVRNDGHGSDDSSVPRVRADDPSVHRQDGDLLIEGPRVTRLEVDGKPLFLMGFSAGDFPTNRYGMHFAYARTALGPFQPLTDAQGMLVDFAKPFRDDKNLSWGPARPYIFTDAQDRPWVAFHAVDRSMVKELDGAKVDYNVWPKKFEPFYRNVYVAPLDLAWKSEAPSIRVVSEACR